MGKNEVIPYRLSLFHKFWLLLDNSQKKSLIAMICLMFLGMLVEAMGIGLILPILGLVTNSGLVDKYPQALPLLLILGYPERSKMIFFVLGVMVGAYLFKFMVFKRNYRPDFFFII